MPRRMPGCRGAGKHDLVVTMEDATSAIYSMFLVDEEGTASSLRGVREVVSRSRACSARSTPIEAATTSRRRRRVAGCRRRC